MDIQGYLGDSGTPRGPPPPPETPPWSPLGSIAAAAA